MSRWFRHYAGMMRDEKLVRVAVASKQPIERVLWVWGAILESAAEINDGGRYELDPGEAAYFLHCEPGDIEAILDGLVLLARIGEGAVARWGDRQYSSDSGAERQRRYRERQLTNGNGANRSNRNGDVPVTSRDAEVTPPESENRDRDTTLTGARDLDGLSERLCEAAGIRDETASPGLLAVSEPLNWLRSGCDLEADVLPTLKAVAAKKRGGPPKTWAYFSNAVFEARDRRLAPAPDVVPRAVAQGPPGKPHFNQPILEAFAEIAEEARNERTRNN